MKRIKTYFLCLVLCTVYFPFIGLAQQATDKVQSRVDSLTIILATLKDDTGKVDVLNKLSFELNYSDAATAEEYALQALSMGKRLNFSKGELQAYYNLGLVYKNIGKFDLSIENC